MSTRRRPAHRRTARTVLRAKHARRVNRRSRLALLLLLAILLLLGTLVGTNTFSTAGASASTTAQVVCSGPITCEAVGSTGETAGEDLAPFTSSTPGSIQVVSGTPGFEDVSCPTASNCQALGGIFPDTTQPSATTTTTTTEPPATTTTTTQPPATTTTTTTTTTDPPATTTTTTQPPATTTTTTDPPATTTTTTQPPATTTTTTTEPLASSGGVVTAGNSKAHCIELNNPGGVITDAQLQAITAVTGVTYNCVETYENPAPQWTDWENPWPFRITSDGWDAWVAENPNHQVVLGVDLIPNAVTNNSDPLTWEQPCDAGDYNQYATQLAENLVQDGAGNTVIRLGIEANGGWETDYVGQTLAEQQDWAVCYDNEVTAMRAVNGAHFLFVWNPNTCTNDLGLANWYPGNSYVDIIGADAYDLDCNTLKTVAEEGWAAYYIDSNAGNDASLSAISAFAVSKGKALSIPEWGEDTGYTDDPAYVQGIASVVNDGDFSFESYFDCGADSIQQLGSSEPLSTAAYVSAFG